MSQTVILYHANCNDGFTAAYIASKVFPDAEFIPVQYGQEPPEVKDKELYILDFSYKRDILLHMAENNRHTIVLDHHKTAKDELSGLSHVKMCIFFDMSKSGAKLTLEHFGQVTGKTKKFNNDLQRFASIVDYVEDRDLWAWKLPHSKEINAYLQSMEKTFENWDRIVNEGVEALVPKGSAILEAQQGAAKAAAANARIIEFEGYNVPILNATALVSETGHELSKVHPFSISYFIRADGKFVFSFRSDNRVDVSAIAKKYGGGGHPNAAGAEMDLNKVIELGIVFG